MLYKNSQVRLVYGLIVGFILFITIFFIFVYALRVNQFHTPYNGKYRVFSKTGNESFYDVTFKTALVLIDSYLNGKENITIYRNDTLICLEAQFDEKQIVTYKDIDEKEVDKNYTYAVPSELSFYKTEFLDKQPNLTRGLDKYDQNSLTPNDYEENDTYKFCYQANPLIDFQLKFGENSVIVIQEQDVVLDSLLTNVTAEAGASNFTHLNISTTAPYDSLVGYWSFDGDLNDTKLTTHYDFTNYDNDGTGAGDAVVNETNCVYGDCLHLDGDSDYVELEDDASLNISGDITMTAWIKITDSASYEHIIGGYQAYPAWDGYGFTVRPASVSYLGPGGWVASNSAVDDGEWHFVAVSVDGSNANFYLDGEPDGTPSASNPGSYAGVRAIGSRSDGYEYFTGTIDEVMIFNTTLTAQQISDIYNNQSKRFAKEGTQQLNNQTYLNITSGNNRVNVTTIIENNFGSNVSLSLGYYDGSWSQTAKQNITSGVNHTYTITDTSTNLTLNYTLIAGNSTHPFYTPIVKGDIVLDYYSVGAPPEGTNCTCYSNYDKAFNMSDYCVISSTCNVNAITFTGTGNFTCDALINASSIVGLASGQRGYVTSNCRGIDR